MMEKVEFHPNIYLIDGVFEGINIIEQAIKEKLHETTTNKNR